MPRVRLLAFAAVAFALTLVPGSVTSAAAIATDGRIAYSGAGKVWVAAADGSRARAIADGSSPSWSPDGRAIAFQSARVPGEGLDVYEMEATGAQQHRLVTHPVDNAANDFDPAWSPLDDTVVFATDRAGNNDIWVSTANGHQGGPLTTSSADDRSPAWSPDAARIAFVSDRDGNDDIYVMSADGSGTRRLTDNVAPDEAPAWSPDGSAIAFQSSRDGNPEIYAMRSDGSGLRRLTDDPAGDTDPAWSPDGNTILFTSDRVAGGHPGVFAMSAAGGAARRVTGSNQPAYEAAWQPAVDLAIGLRGPRAAHAGRWARVTISATNHGPQPASSIVLAARLSRSLPLEHGRASPGTCHGTTVLTCSFERLSSRATIRLTIRVRPVRCGVITLRASVSSVQPEATPSDNRAGLEIPIRCCIPRPGCRQR
jgi:Tol biopolymer transport system component